MKTKKPEALFLAVDPGSRENGGTGLAFFSTHIESFVPKFTYQIKTDGNKWHTRTDHLLEQYVDILKQTLVVGGSRPIYIEQPTFFDTHTGHTAARSDSLYKLIVTFGRLWQASVSLGHVVIPIKIQAWKGQLSKTQVSERVERICGEKYSGDVWDAVGIGLYIKGKF